MHWSDAFATFRLREDQADEGQYLGQDVGKREVGERIVCVVNAQVALLQEGVHAGRRGNHLLVLHHDPLCQNTSLSCY